MSATSATRLPGYWRRIIITPGAGQICAALEDDYHSMGVRLTHVNGIITGHVSQLDRMPWTTCPGAAEMIARTFVGIALTDAAARGEKFSNCTHLYDLTLLAAAHAGEDAPLTYDLHVDDPDAQGVINATILRDGAPVLTFSHRDDVMIAPAQIAGLSLFKLRPWIETLEPGQKEAARLLQWGTIIAHGRYRPIAQQSDASKMPPNCFTFQPERRGDAQRIGAVFDFSQGSVTPLDHYQDGQFAVRVSD